LALGGRTLTSDGANYFVVVPAYQQQ
jgi:hypothetical protein